MRNKFGVAALFFGMLALVGCAAPSNPQTSAIDCVLAGGKSIQREGRHVACVADDSEGGKCRAKGGTPIYDARGELEECQVSTYDAGKEIIDHFNKTLRDVGSEMMK